MKVEDIKEHFFDNFSKYKYIFETCFNEIPRDILIRALLTFAEQLEQLDKKPKSPYFKSHAVYYGWDNHNKLHKFSLCEKEAT